MFYYGSESSCPDYSRFAKISLGYFAPWTYSMPFSAFPDTAGGSVQPMYAPFSSFRVHRFSENPRILGSENGTGEGTDSLEHWVWCVNRVLEH